MSTAPATAPSTDVIATLDLLLKGEYAAVTACEQAVTHLAGAHLVTLAANQQSHGQRIRILTERILQLGGDPTITADGHGAVIHAVEGAAAILGPGVVLAVLEQDEKAFLDRYREALDQLDQASRTLVMEDLLPAQANALTRISQAKAATATEPGWRGDGWIGPR